MFSKINSASLLGINGYLVNVEVDLSDGLPSFDVVGLPDSSVRESKERVKAAIKNTNIKFPIKHITVNLSPADIKKVGPSFDLPIAVGILTCINIIPKEQVINTMFIGELSLDGTIQPVSGILPMISSATQNGISTCFVPYNNTNEAALIPNVNVIGVNSLLDLINHLNGINIISPYSTNNNSFTLSSSSQNSLDFSQVKGQETVKRAFEIAASGSHNLLMIGPPGSGKTMMAKRLPSILPNLTLNECVEITKIYSICSKLPINDCLIKTRPFRSPHHTITPCALTGGGRIPKPGEVSLSHNGVLFLDELTEFSKNTLEVLRQPLEDNIVTISRVNSTLTYPCNFMLISSMNPCPCGYYPDLNKCSCTPYQIKKYLNKISGPLLDRIDLTVEASSVKYEDLSTTFESESSLRIKERVTKCQLIQQERYKSENILFNSQLSSSQLTKYCNIDSSGKKILEKAFKKLDLSARAYHRILKIGRTIADLEESENICSDHLAEAIQYRSLDKKYWS